MNYKTKIVLAEDSKTQAAQTKFILEEQGYSVDVAENGKLAYDLICRSLPSVVITDVVMPEMNGYDLCRAIRSNPKTNMIPIMLLTNLNLPDDVQNGLISGADDYLPKPIDEKLLIEHVDRIVESKGTTIKYELIEDLSNQKVLNFLMSTYETAILKTRELESAKKELSILNQILEEKVEERTAQLEQRIRELKCLQEINGLYESIDHSSKELVKQTCYILRNSFPDPSKIDICITMNGERFCTENFNDTYQFKISGAIKSLRKVIGTIEVSYNMETKSDPFASYEKKLIKSVAQRMFELYELEEKERKIILQNEQLTKSIENIQMINRELEESRKKAVESDRLKSAFLANMSHEIRTPLNSIVGFTDIFDDPEIDLKTREQYGHIIKESSMHLLAIVNDILDISKIETGQMAIVITSFSLLDVLVSVNNFFQKVADDNGISLNLVPLVNENCIIKTDQNKLKQILNNLISNALKFTSKGSVEFGVLQFDNEAIFYVKDTGIGIADSFKDKVFERFSQFESSTIRHYGGTGLGLAISKRLVELLGGLIWYESVVDKGTTFYFKIPVEINKCLDLETPP